jgi:hypothetical protein
VRKSRKRYSLPMDREKVDSVQKDEGIVSRIIKYDGSTNLSPINK